MVEFRWNEWNLEHATSHGCSVVEAERVVFNARSPWPRPIGDEKWMVEGRGQGDRMVRVVYVIDAEATVYIIHAMPLTTRRRKGR